MSWTDQWDWFFVNKLSVRLNKSRLLRPNLPRPVITNRDMTGEWKPLRAHSMHSQINVRSFGPSPTYRYIHKHRRPTTVHQLMQRAHHVSPHTDTVQMPSKDTHLSAHKHTHTHTHSTVPCVILPVPSRTGTNNGGEVDCGILKLSLSVTLCQPGISLYQKTHTFAPSPPPPPC